ncbi:MAG: FtsQ-type POTRA domain-containing protein [Candidatus Omnitrophica bacterium]|nr:FtsQ-type POTRA domain-containing protein [Candidatus Omnitrophota bacterium]
MAKSVRRGRSKNTFSVKVLGVVRRVGVFCLPYFLVLAVLGVLLGSVAAYAVNSPTFELQEARVLNVGTLTPEQAFRFCELKRGENLIALDLGNVQQVIKRKHPEFKEVRVRRVLPSRIEVVVKRRTPAVQIAFSRYIQVDKDLVILPGSSAVPFKNLTIIEGTPVPRGGLYVGARLTDPGTSRALKLADLVRRSGLLRKHLLTKVDMTDPKNLSLIVDGAVEIRLGSSHFIERLKLLDQTLKTLELDQTKIAYIDLRFDDVVIGSR